MTLPYETRQRSGLLGDPAALQRQIECALQLGANPQPLWIDDHPIDQGLSVVLLLIGPQSAKPGHPPVPCLILNKRSLKVRQPGDICCPGGGIIPKFDRLTAGLLHFPGTPLRQWGYYRWWRQHAPWSISRLSLLLATALREAMEEMRLNPLGVRFQGMLPPEQLVMFNKIVYPLVGWVKRQRRFFPNWEVARIVRIPISELLSPAGYVRLRLQMVAHDKSSSGEDIRDFPAFRDPSAAGDDILWGVTYRITMAFLHRVFGFVPPDTLQGPFVEKRLAVDYLTGRP
jgi:hypothetical protein